MNDRIKLAEAMGWRREDNEWSDDPIWKKPNAIHEYREAVDLPDPFTDANDDYAVLEWIRAIEAEGLDRELFHMKFATELCGLKSMYDYQVGDYARAALKVIE